LALALNLAAGDSGRFADFSDVMYARSATGKEVDFCGRRLGSVAFEGKYTDRSLARESPLPPETVANSAHFARNS